MNNLLLLHINFVASTIGERAMGHSKLLFRRRVEMVNPFRTLGIHQVSAHIAVALVHEEALTLCAILRIWAPGAIFHGLLGGHLLPRSHDSLTNLRFGLGTD